MITAEILKPYRDKASDHEETKSLKSDFAKLKRERIPLYLTKDDLDKILKWKLRSQYWRQSQIRQDNINDIIKSVTALGLNICHKNKDYELELRLSILKVLRGVGVPVASAILALIYPEEYAVIDRLNWRVLYNKDKEEFTINQYKKYLSDIKSFAKELKWLPQEVDLAVWAYAEQNIGLLK